MIELREYVSQVLTEIASGSQDAKEDLKEIGATVNDHLRLTSVKQVTEVKFDVSISTSIKKKKGGKAGIFVGNLGVGGDIENSSTNGSVGRIQFSIMLHLPSGKLK